jgi:hypothetical protein
MDALYQLSYVGAEAIVSLPDRACLELSTIDAANRTSARSPLISASRRVRYSHAPLRPYSSILILEDDRVISNAWFGDERPMSLREAEAPAVVSERYDAQLARD